jgi:PIN like domain
MRSKFHGYFKIPQEETAKVWSNCIFCLDANVLLNIYRYSNETRIEFLKVLGEIQQNIKLPYQASREFFNNRLNVIGQQEKTYSEMIDKLTGIEDALTNKRQHPFIKEELLKDLIKTFKSVKSELDIGKKEYGNIVISDSILERLGELLDGKIGENYTQERISEICKLGEERFKKKIPPGFKDAAKEGRDDEQDTERKYGDLILWNQLIDISKSDSKNMIFVTDDRKEDWWLRFQGKTISPRPELLHEFKEKTGHSVFIYHSDNFLEYAVRTFLKKKINQSVLDEVRQLRRSDESEISKNRSIKYPDIEKMAMANRLRTLELQLHELVVRKRYIQNQIEILSNSGAHGLSSAKAVHDFNANIDVMKKELGGIQILIDNINNQMLDGRKSIVEGYLSGNS